jgi:hypothetical protein
MLNGNSSKHCVFAHYHMEFCKSEQLFDLTSFGPRTSHAKFGSIWLSSYAEED